MVGAAWGVQLHPAPLIAVAVSPDGTVVVFVAHEFAIGANIGARRPGRRAQRTQEGPS